MNMVIVMVCKNCGKQILSGNVCAECNKPKGFINNTMRNDLYKNEYITEKYNMKKGVYEGKATEHNNSVIGLVIMIVIVLIIIGVAVANYIL